MQMCSIDYIERQRKITAVNRKKLVGEREQKKKIKSEEVMRRKEQQCSVFRLFYDSSKENKRQIYF